MEPEQGILGTIPPIKRFPEGMTGRQYKKSIGTVSERQYACKSFKVKHKFLTIKRKNRLAFLKKMVKITAKPSLANLLNEPKDMRLLFNLTKNESLPLTSNCPCYVCDNGADVRHHVITLQNGGRNKNNNIVPLCYSCHAKVHPHLLKLNKMRKVASRHSVHPKINGPLVTTRGTNNTIVAVQGA